MKKIALIIALCLSGCTTIHFDNGTDVSGLANAPKWHHIGILSLVEFSAPVNLETECGNKEWNSVQTELTFLNGLASSIVNSVVPAAWSPKTVEVTCK